MSSTGTLTRTPRVAERAPLVVDTVRVHRWGALAWIVGALVAMYAIGAGFASEVARFSGGARAMADSLRGGVEAMRLLRWPADRLDTLGGYLTYHNVTLFSLGLCLYAAIQGSHAIRGAEADGVPALILSAPRSRAQLLGGRAAGFAVTTALISVGLGAALAVAMAAGGAPDTSGSFVTAAACGLAALDAYALGVLVSQLTWSARAGTALAGLLVTALYLLTNVWDKTGWAGWLRFASPFHYQNSWRWLVPGHQVDPGSGVMLVALPVVTLALAVTALRRRDFGAGLWTAPVRAATRPPKVQRPSLRAVWSAALVRQRAGLLAWGGCAAATVALMVSLEPSVADLWDKFSYTQRILPVEPGRTVADLYLSLAGQFVVPIVIAYVMVQAAAWVAELRRGEVELLLSTPLSWSRLVGQRLLAAVLGALLITVAAIAGLVVAAVAVGADVDPAGLLRLAGDTVLLAAAVAGVSALVVAWLRTGAAVAVLAVFVAASYLTVFLVPLFAWPDWVLRGTVFGAFGDPYLELPAATGLVVLTGLAVAGTLLAAVVAEHSPKAAS